MTSRTFPKTSIWSQKLSTEWQELCRSAQIAIRENEIDVLCGPSRHQRVYVDDTDPQLIRLWAIVATRGAAEQVHEVALQARKMNRFRELVRFKISEYGRMIGECWVPIAGISADEWRTYVNILARACDRLECLWTGRDIE
jgi:hypothetical protein